MTTREELQHEIDVRAEERSEYEGSRQCRRTEELDEQLALYKLALIGLDAQELQERLRVTADDRAALHSENLELKAQLRTARSDALEEAAKVCEVEQAHYAGRANKYEQGRYTAAELLAFNIRALKEST